MILLMRNIYAVFLANFIVRRYSWSVYGINTTRCIPTISFLFPEPMKICIVNFWKTIAPVSLFYLKRATLIMTMSAIKPVYSCSPSMESIRISQKPLYWISPYAMNHFTKHHEIILLIHYQKPMTGFVQKSSPPSGQG